MLPAIRHAAIALVAAGTLTACHSNDAVAPPPPPSWNKLAVLSSAAFGIASTHEGHLLTTLIDDGFLERVQLTNAAAPHDGVDVGGTPSVIATSNDGSSFYVANMAGWVEARSSATGSQIAQAGLGDAHSLSVAPDGRVWVGGSAGHVYAFTPNLSLLASIDVPGGPWGMAFHNVGSSPRVYVTARDAGTITEIDRSTNTIIRVMNVHGRPHGLVITPAGDKLFAADNQSNVIKVVDVASGTVTAQIPFMGAFGLAISPDGKTLYASGDQGDVAVINVSSGEVLQTWATGGQARQIVTSDDGNRAYFANMGGWIDVVTR